MLRIILEVDAPGWAAQGVKEYAAMTFERFGDTRVIEVTELGREPIDPCQLTIEGPP